MKLAAIVGLTALMFSHVAAADATFEKGKKVFMEAKPACSVCHTLADAGSAGQIGPNLDELAPSMKQVKAAVSSGVGVMPSFQDSLSSDDINAVAHYVAKVTGGGK
ncbi:cytochrome c [Marinobacter sp. CHS3-4]|uniref:SorU family sulfite dehydrogenase c-type cytochrome subunit n=1 Tax=Marinobacter sp. CHS3-4 TaxID=3045174 RepID=UPI0024B52B85|nr:cytochrome c [Marinobacter sp. CHS3-4]MDI9244347.1 cytochrome c [Marinobacter sp. CHS3-4]